jgi:hypothetical protein
MFGPLWPTAFAFTYSSAALTIRGRTFSLIGWIEGTVVFYFVPSLGRLGPRPKSFSAH